MGLLGSSRGVGRVVFLLEALGEDLLPFECSLQSLHSSAPGLQSQQCDQCNNSKAFSDSTSMVIFLSLFF